MNAPRITHGSKLRLLLDSLSASARDTIARPLRGAVHYLITAEIARIVSAPEGEQSLDALFRSDVADLPFRYMLVEIATDTDECAFVILAREDKDPSGDAIGGGLWHVMRHRDLKTARDAPVYSARLLVLRERPVGVGFANGYALVRLGSPAMPCLLTVVRGGPDFSENAADEFLTTVKLAVKAVLLAGCTIGIEREPVEIPERLNKARLRRGKPPIMPYTVIRIGHTYGRDGRRHEPTGRHVRTHLRAGHVRQQPVGPGRRERKLVFIKPALVNYKPDSDTPATPIRLVKV